MESSIAHLLIKYSGWNDRSLKYGKEYLQYKRILNVGPIQGLDAELRGLALYLPVDQQHIMSRKILCARDGLPFDAVCATQVDSLEMAEKLNTVLAQNGILITAEDERIASGLGEPSLWTIDEDVYGVYHKRVQTEIAFSGERFIPGIEDKKLEAEHMQRYLSVRNLVKGMQVLDLACGEGYGSALLAETAESVIGIDIDQGTIDQAQKKYQKENLRYMEGDAAAIPLPDHSVDAVVSFETIEHISEELQQKFLREINRVLKPDGLVIMSTPNKAIYSDRYSYFNEYHIHEFYPDEFVLFLKQFFPYVRMYQQSFQVVSLLSDCESADGQAFWYGNKVEAGEAKYLIAVASRRKNALPEMSSLFLETAGEYEENIQRIVRLQNEETMRNLHIRTLDGELAEKGDLIQRLQTEQAERDAHIQELDQEVTARGERIQELQEEETRRNQHIQSLDSELQERGNLIQQLQEEQVQRDQHIKALDSELAEKGDLIQRLQTEQAERDAHIQELDQEVTARGERIQELQEEETRRNQHIQTLDSELQERGKLIQQFQEEQVQRDQHIKALDSELAEKGDLIQRLQTEQAERDAHIQELDQEVTARGERIQELQEEETRRNQHIQNLDSELQEKGKLIQQLQAEQAERDVHIQELDQEMAQRVSRILELQDEVAQKNQHIHTLNDNLEENGSLIQRMQAEEKENRLRIQRLDAELNEKEKTIEKVTREKEEVSAYMENVKELIVQLNKERDQLRDDNQALKQECSRIASERDHMEEQRNTLVKERDELKEYHQQLKTECEKLHETIKELNTELNNKKGHIELLLESDRELERIHHSRHWKVMTAYWKVRDFVFPHNSRRRLLVKLAAKFIRHPIGCLKRVDVRHIKTFVDGLKSGSIESTSARLDNYLGGSVGNPDRPNQIPIVEYKTKEDAPHFHVPSSNHPVVSIVIPVYNQFHYTYACLKTIAMNSGDVPYEVIVANDCSTDLTTQLTKIITGVKVVTNKENLRFLRNCNNAAKHAGGKYILFLNNDTQVQKNWLSSLVELIERDEKIGMVGSKLVYPDGRLQEAGGILWRDGSAWNYGNGKDPAMPEYNYVKDVDYISGAAIMIRANLWREIGGFDDQFAPAYYEDTDLAFEVRRHGYRVVYQPLSVVIHFEGVSNGTDTSGGLKAYQVKNQKAFYEKWKDVLAAHKPNAECVFRARERSLDKPVLLFVDHYVPEFDKDAGSRAAYQYIQLFVHQGFQVKFIGDNFFHSLPYTTVLEQMGVEVLCGDWYYMHWKEWLKENAVHFDYAILSRPHIAVNYIDILRQHSKAHIAYFGHDLHYLRAMREYETTRDKSYLNESNSWHEKEYALMRKMDVVFYFSTVETEMIKKEAPTINAVAIPVYIFDSVPDTPYRFEDRKDLFFVGGFGHRPNLDAVEWLVSEIMPLVRKAVPEIQLHIAGSKMPNEIKELDGKNGIVIEGTVSDERLRELYGQSRMTVVPLRYGAGVKGKVIESMYNGIPLVTTTCGAEGIEGAKNTIIALDTADEIAKKIVALYNDKAALEKLSAGQREIVKKYFSEAHAVEIMDMVYHFSGKKESMH